MNESRITLDLSKGGPAPVVTARAGERRAKRVTALVLDCGLPADLGGHEVSFECMGDGWHAAAECEVDGSLASFELPPFDEPCDVRAAYVRVSGGGSVRTTGDFAIRVVGRGAGPCSRYGSS